jgi:hypothetical protein
MIGAQNDEMRSLNFQIKKLRHPQDKQVYIGFVNTVSGLVSWHSSCDCRGRGGYGQEQACAGSSWDDVCGLHRKPSRLCITHIVTHSTAGGQCHPWLSHGSR